MGIAIVLLLGMIGFAVMSRPFKIVALLGVMGFGLAVLEARWHVGIMPRGLYLLVREWFQGENGLRRWFALYGSFTGLMGLGVFLGVVRKASSTAEAYVLRRKAILLFLAQWGGLFVVFRILVEWLINLVADDGVGWVVVQFFPVPMLIVYALLVVSFTRWWGKRREKTTAGETHLNRMH